MILVKRLNSFFSVSTISGEGQGKDNCMKMYIFVTKMLQKIEEKFL